MRDVWGVTTTVAARLTEPLAATLRRHVGSDPSALRDAMTGLIDRKAGSP